MTPSEEALLPEEIVEGIKRITRLADAAIKAPHACQLNREFASNHLSQDAYRIYDEMARAFMAASSAAQRLLPKMEE